MSLEYSPVRNNQGARDTSGADPPDDPDYWNALIDEKAAAAFLGVTVRFLQGRRQRGDGPQFIRMSSRCIRFPSTSTRRHIRSCPAIGSVLNRSA